MKFSSGIAVLLYWYDYGEAVKNYSIPAVFITEEEGLSKPPYLAPEHFDYPDWWYTWVDVDKIIRKLTRRNWALILYYFKNIHQCSTGTFHRWQHKEEFKAMCHRIYQLLDADEYKTNQWGYRKFERVLVRIKDKVERGEINVKCIDPNTVYTPKEVADMLRYTVDTIYKLLNAGKLRGFRATGQWRITGQALLDLINTDPKEVDDE